MTLRNGPVLPKFPLSLVHPLGPLFRYLPLSLRRHLLYLRYTGRWGNFRTPVLWSEKMQWRILNDRRAILVVACDKLASKALVASIATRLNITIAIPETYWVGTDVRELQRMAERLPARWVLKPNHSSGRVRLLDSAAAPINWSDLIAAGDRWMQPDEQTTVLGQWGYAGARRLLIAEQRLGGGAEPPDDLRAQVVSGVIERVDLSIGLDTPAHRIASYERDLVTRYASDFEMEIPHDARTAVDAITAEERDAIRAAIEAIGTYVERVRVDGYFVEGRYWFGELTVYTASGLSDTPLPFDRRIGAPWQLPDLSAPDPREAEWRTLLTGTPRGTLQ